VELIVIRHARPDREEHDHREGPADPSLSPLGMEQAAVTADLLATAKIDHIVASTMRRAVQTAEPLAAGLGLAIEQVDDLKESDHLRSEYVPAEELTTDHPFVVDYMAATETVFGGEYDGFRTRVGAAFDGVVERNPGRTVAVFCHGMVIGVFLQTILGHPDPFALFSDYCGITRVTASATGLRTIRSINEVAHVRHLDLVPRTGFQPVLPEA